MTSQPGTVSGRVVEPIVPFRETRIGVCGSMCSTCSAWAKNALQAPRRAPGLRGAGGSFQTT